MTLRDHAHTSTITSANIPPASTNPTIDSTGQAPSGVAAGLTIEKLGPDWWLCLRGQRWIPLAIPSETTPSRAREHARDVLNYLVERTEVVPHPRRQPNESPAKQGTPEPDPRRSPVPLPYLPDDIQFRIGLDPAVSGPSESIAVTWHRLTPCHAAPTFTLETTWIWP